MKPIAYNYLGEIVCEDDQGHRAAGRNRARLDLEVSAPSNVRFLRCSPAAPESIWLAAIAFCFQPRARPIAINEFFKICTQHLSHDEREKTLLQFVVECLHAFYRSRKPAFDHPLATASSFADVELHFSELGLHKALAKFPDLSRLAAPKAVLGLRAYAKGGTLSSLANAPPYFDPFDQTENACEAHADAPWSLSVDSRLSRSRESTKGGPTHSLADLWTDPRESSILIFHKGELAFTTTQAEALGRLVESANTQIGTSGRHPYLPLSRAGQSDSSLTTSLTLAHQRLRESLASNLPDWDARIAKLIGIPVAVLSERLSPEQIDACGLATHSFASRKSFILADETGLGKGRALAALARAFIQSGRPVVFLTEKKHLFSDFWRDLIDVYGTDAPPPTPFLLHPKGRILTQSGELVTKAPSPTKYREQLATRVTSSPLLFSTYSQFNRDAKHADKFELISNRLKGALLILDESHNASGESQTRANIFSFIDLAEKCVFSSATYAKHEQAFELYASATPLTRNEMALLLASFSGGDPLAASNSIAHGLVSIGSMVRREHLPEQETESRILSPAPEDQERIVAHRQALHRSLEDLFTLQDRIDWAKQRIGEEPDASWMRLGGVLARVCRQFNLLSKIDLACESAAQLAREGKKPVLAMESTFEAFLRAQISWIGNSGASMETFESDEELADADEPAVKKIPLRELSFRALFRLIIETIAPEDLLRKLTDPDVSQAKALAIKSTDNLPEWLASPLDLLRQNLESKNLRVGEISGRSMIIELQEDGMAQIASRAVDDRESLVRSFNAGSLDVLLLTQAGASGISLHSAPHFLDRRPRAFVELEICANPSQRMQFLGRVRRKGQVVSPEYLVVSSGSPYEHRLIERATSKQMKLSGLTSATQSLAAGSLSVANRLITPKGDKIAEEWLKGKLDVAKRLGIDVVHGSKPLNGDTISERLLKRLPLLPATTQDEIFSFMTAALEIDQRKDLPEHTKAPYFRTPILARNAPIWGPAGPAERSLGPQPFEPVVYLQEWLCMPPVGNVGSRSAQARIQKAQEGMRAGRVEKMAAAATKAIQQSSAHPEMRALLSNMREAARHMAPGSKIRVSHPDTGRPLDGVLVEIESPANAAWQLNPSQWKLSALFPGQPFELSLSLATFLSDPCAYLEMAPPPPARVWDNYQQRPYHFSTIEGHCGYSRWYAGQFGTHLVARFHDSEGVARELSSAPVDATLEQARAWKIPLIDPRLTLQLLQHDTHQALDNAALDGQEPTAKIAPTGGGWTLVLERTLHDSIMDFALDRRLGPRRYHPTERGQMVARFISIKDIHSVIPMLHNRMCRFFAPASRSRWHANALELLLLTAKPARKKTTRR